MRTKILREAEKYAKQHRRQKIWRKFVQVMGCIVVFCTTYALILPAITMEKTPCDLSEHTHSESCYEKVTSDSVGPLICTYESLGVHVHTPDCYDDENRLICGQVDYLIHKHNDDCVDENGTVVCRIPEISAHEHTDDCYSVVETEPDETETMEAEDIHVHGDDCYATQRGELTCQFDETEGHAHGQSCFTQGDLICRLTNQEGHTHGEGCSETVLVCNLTVEPHVHGDGCYQQLVCEIPEGEDHTHSEECSGNVLICDLTEQPHTHTDGCYQTNVLCDLHETEGHVHGADCYESLLTCELSEEPAHQHTDECYEMVSALVCGLEEGIVPAATTETLEAAEPELELICTEPAVQVHIHGEGCFAVESAEEDVLTCTLPEDENHTHSEICYGTWELICGKEEHTHDLVCQNDPEADVEMEADWVATFADVALTGEWDEDLLAIARSQLGYCESTRNYEVLEDGETTRGYTRYGAWYGDPYGDWCGVFVSFCLNYADIPQDAIPYEANCPDWIEALQTPEFDLYRPAGEYTPVPGDLIFFDWDGDGISDQVGIVSEFALAMEDEPAKIKAIGGNMDDQVAEQEYELDDIVILGYGQLPATRYCGMEKHTHGADCMDEAENLICTRDEHIHSEDCLIKNSYFCGKEEHAHGTECTDVEGNLICGSEEHTHAEACLTETVYLCGLEEHAHAEACRDENGEVVCGLEEHAHFILCTDPEARTYCWRMEHSHDENCLDESGDLICGLDSHTHTADCCDYISSLIVMIDTLPTSEEAEEILLAYEETEDWDGYAAYQQTVSDLAWQLYYACEELDEEDLTLVTNYDRLMDLSWLWGAVTYDLPAKSPYYPMDNGEWITNLPADHQFYEYVHVNKVVPDEYTVDGLILGAKQTKNCEPSFEPVFSESLENLTDEECVALTGHKWKNLESAGFENTYGANLILPANDAEHDALVTGKKNFVVYRNVGTYEGETIHLLIQIVNYKPFEDEKGVLQDGILGFYTNGYIGITVCGLDWVKMQYNFIPNTHIEEAITKAKNGESLTGLRKTIKGSTSFYDVDYSQAVHMYGSDNTPWNEILKGIYVTNVSSDVPDLSAVDALTSNTDKRDYFRDWTQNDCVLKIGTVNHMYESWTGPAIFSSHPYDAADEDWRTDSKHGVTMTFDHGWFYLNYSFDKGRNAEGGIRHFGEPVSRGGLTIKKEVTGTNVTADEEFEFQITFHKQKSDGSYVADDALNGTYGGVTLTEGVGTFKLKNGESITINNIPIRQHGTHYRVTELGYDGYIVETSMTNQVLNEEPVTYGPYTQAYFESSIQPDSAMAQRQTVVFENYGGPVLPNTGGAGTYLYTMGGLLLMAAAALMYSHLSKRRKEDMPSF